MEVEDVMNHYVVCCALKIPCYCLNSLIIHQPWGSNPNFTTLFLFLSLPHTHTQTHTHCENTGGILSTLRSVKVIVAVTPPRLKSQSSKNVAVYVYPFRVGALQPFIPKRKGQKSAFPGSRCAVLSRSLYSGSCGVKAEGGSWCFPLLCQTGQRCHVQLMATTQQHLALRRTHSAASHHPARQVRWAPPPPSQPPPVGWALSLNNHELLRTAIGWQEQFLVNFLTSN